MLRLCRRFARSETGAINLEYMLWFPLFMFWILGFTTLFDGYARRNEAAKAAYALTDILSREQEVSCDSLDNYHLLLAALTPTAVGDRMLRVSSIKFDGTDYSIAWTQPYNTVDLTLEELEEMPIVPLDTISTGQSLLLVELEATYDFAISLNGTSSRTYDFLLAVRPRKTVEIKRVC